MTPTRTLVRDHRSRVLITGNQLQVDGHIDIRSVKGAGIRASDAIVHCQDTNVTANWAIAPTCNVPTEIVVEPESTTSAICHDATHNTTTTVARSWNYTLNESCKWTFRCQIETGRVYVNISELDMPFQLGGSDSISIFGDGDSNLDLSSFGEDDSAALQRTRAFAVQGSTVGLKWRSNHYTRDDGAGFSVSVLCCGNAHGGGVFLERGKATLQRVRFEDNAVGQSLNGVAWHMGNEALYAAHVTSLFIKDSHFAHLDAATVNLVGVPNSGTVAGCRPHMCSRGETCNYNNFSVSCAPCDKEEWSTDGLVCAACASGSSPSADHGACVPCAAGRAGIDGRCIACRPGTFVQAHGSARCGECPQARFSAGFGNRHCAQCTRGRYQDSVGTAGCIECVGSALSMRAVFSAQTRCGQCVQLSFLNVSCAADQFPALAARPANCSSCDELPCVDCGNSSMGRGWRPSQLGVLLRCPHEAACPSTSNGSSCAVGFHGLLCGACIPGYRRTRHNGCTSADGVSCAASWAMGVVCLALLGILAARAAVRLCSRQASTRIDRWSLCAARGRTRAHVMADGAAMLFARQSQTTANPLSFETAREVAAGSADQQSSVLSVGKSRRSPTSGIALLGQLEWMSTRIVISMFQVVYQLGDVLHFRFPRAVQHALGAMSLLALQVSSVLHVDCWLQGLGPEASFYLTWWTRVAGVPLVLLGGTALYCTLSSIKSWQPAVSLTLFLAYPDLCSAGFSLFNCRRLGPAPEHNRLVADAAVACSGSLYNLHRGLAQVVVAAVVLLPCAFLWKLTREGEEPQEEAVLVHLVSVERGIRERTVRDIIRDVGRNQRFSFLTSGYRPSHTFWEAIDMLRKCSVLGVASLTHKGSVELGC